MALNLVFHTASNELELFLEKCVIDLLTTYGYKVESGFFLLSHFLPNYLLPI